MRAPAFLLGLAALTLTADVEAQGLPLDTDAAREVGLSDAPRPLTLGRVLAAVQRHQPELRAALARARRAAARELRAEGGFDPQLSVRGEVITGGYYDLLRADAELSQQTGVWGAEVYAGYRVGLGLDDEQRFPTYYGDDTLDRGEVRVGVEIPLWRDGPIDSTRATLWAAEDRAVAADRAADAVALDVSVAASRAYFRWVAAGHKLRIAEQQRALAAQRDEQLRQREIAGSASAFDVTENLRSLIDRDDKMVQARQAFDIAAVALGFYLRDRGGEMQVPEPSRLPSLRPVTMGRLSPGAMAQAVACHPALRELRAEQEALRTELFLAENRVAPDIRATFEVSRDLGDESRDITLPGTVIQAGLRFSMPLFLREGRGQASEARAKLDELEAKLRRTEDRIRNALETASLSFEAASSRAELAERLVATSEALAAGERARFEAGASTLFLVNRREVAAADAANRFIDALGTANLAEFQFETLSSIDC
ncbi:MAG: TolC family protein [Myxococcota bacterium]